MKFIKKFGVLIMAFGLWGCASKPVDQYSEFAGAGHEYAYGLSKVFDFAEATAIDRSSTDLVAENALVDRESGGFINQELNRLAEAGVSDAKRIQAFTIMRKHVQAMSRYFAQLSELAKTRYVAQTAGALVETARTIESLTSDLGGSVLGGGQSFSASNAKPYVIGARQRTTLKRRIKADAHILQSALAAHESILGIIADDLAHDIAMLSDRKQAWLVKQPFIGAQPLSQNPVQLSHWLEHRRKLLLRESKALELIRSSREATGKLSSLLREMVKNEKNIARHIELFRAELDSITAASQGMN